MEDFILRPYAPPPSPTLFWVPIIRTVQFRIYILTNSSVQASMHSDKLLVRKESDNLFSSGGILASNSVQVLLTNFSSGVILTKFSSGEI
uniref:Uncharacterized protein n=1 Tax=Meloidogyne incognita TaxID=6306 RepID=A0A914MSG7_MELIC